MIEKYKDRDWLYQEYIINKRSMLDIARECGKPNMSMISWYMKKFGIQKRTLSETLFNIRKHESVNITEEVDEFIIGNILGDGSIIFPKKGRRCGIYGHSSKYLDMLKYISDFLSKNDIEQMGNINKQIHKKHNSPYYCYQSKHYEDLIYYKERFYKDGKKCVPRDLTLTPIICLHWFIGDGSLTKPKPTGKPYIRICTQGFSVSDVEFLRDKLTKLGFKTYRRPSENSLRISSHNTKDFLEYIGECPEEIKHIYNYKFEI